MISTVKRGKRQTAVKLKDDLLFLTCYLLTIEVTNVKIATMHAREAGGHPPHQKIATMRPKSLNSNNLKLLLNSRLQPVAN